MNTTGANFVQDPTRIGDSLGASAVVSFLPILVLFVVLGLQFRVRSSIIACFTCKCVVYTWNALEIRCKSIDSSDISNPSDTFLRLSGPLR